MTENSLEQGQVAAADIALSSPELDSRLDAMLADPRLLAVFGFGDQAGFVQLLAQFMDMGT